MFRVAQRLEANEHAFGRFLLAALALGFALLVAAVLAAAAMADRTREHGFWVAHTLKVEVAIDRAQVIIEQGETARRGYLLAGEQQYLDAYAGFAALLPSAIERLSLLTRDNPRQQGNVALYRRQVAALVAAREHTIALMRAGGPAQARRDFIAEAAYARPRAIR
uniref:CHASE3 domain-containing protein n=1 Tax=Sphingomonas bacterium TaxID=1895847 RepID=UPI0015765A52